MTMVDIPQMIVGVSETKASRYIALDSAALGERCALCGYWTTPDGASRTITHICVGLAAITTGGDLLVQIESIDSATGLPNGIISAGVSGTYTVGAGDSYTLIEQALTNNYSLTSGSWLAVTGQITGGTDVKINTDFVMGGNARAFIYMCADLNGAGWAKDTYLPSIMLKTSLGEYITPLNGNTLTSVLSMYLNTSTDQFIGNKVVAPYDVLLSGVFIGYIDIDYNINIKLLESDGSLAVGDDAVTNMSIPIDAEYRYGTTYYMYSSIAFPCPKTLLANTTYYLVFEATVATSILLRASEHGNAATKALSAGIPSGWTLDLVTSPTAWSPTVEDLQVAQIFPVFTKINMPAGGGGPLIGGRLVC